MPTSGDLKSGGFYFGPANPPPPTEFTKANSPFPPKFFFVIWTPYPPTNTTTAEKFREKNVDLSVCNEQHASRSKMKPETVIQA